MSKRIGNWNMTWTRIFWLILIQLRNSKLKEITPNLNHINHKASLQSFHTYRADSADYCAQYTGSVAHTEFRLAINLNKLQVSGVPNLSQPAYISRDEVIMLKYSKDILNP